MRFSVYKLQVLMLGTLASMAPAAFGQTVPDAEAEAQKKFELSAQVLAKPTLSRSEIDPSAVGIKPAAQLPKQVPMPPQNYRPRPAAQSGLLASTQDDDPQAYLQEYDVDWSTWISKQADRWYFMLKSSETMLGLHFVTERPAMIQFTCYADGTIGNVVLKQSSGVPVYDRLQVETLLATLPCAPFPKGTHRNSITLCQGWESHPRQPGESDFQPGSFGRDFPKERVRQWRAGQ